MDRRKLTDRDVRAALLAQVLAAHSARPETLLVQEFGLSHGACRVDICVINGSFHGYELKSESDSLTRLPSQVELYGQCLDRCTLVSSPNHLKDASALLPSWWGIKVAEPIEGGAKIHTLRAARKNPAPSARHIAALLWRDEAELLLTCIGAPSSAFRGNRQDLYTYLATMVPMPHLRRFVRELVKTRGNWRRPALHA